MSNDSDQEYTRTATSLIIKTITTHAFALASYAYACSLLRRPTRTHIQACRIIFFAFIPTLPLVELLISASRSLIQFVRNYEDDDKIHVRYYVSGALGMHANLSQDDDNKDTKDRSKNLHLLSLGSHCAEKTVQPVDWIWVGKILAALFSLTQAVGTIVMWVRRMTTREANALSFDHRNGAMGIASAICCAVCMLVLVLRLQWKVSKAFQAPQKGYAMDETSRFVGEALLAMLLHLGIATIADEGNCWLYSSVGSVFFLINPQRRVFGQAWQSLILVVFVYIFRHEISNKMGLNGERFQKYFGGNKIWRRVKTLLGLALVLWICVDLVRLFVVDVLQVVREYDDREYRYGNYWWQDPLSDELIVI
ncbi:hypothetical protein CC78DRAFT_535144 [Lojkania enalia]|uniref:Uncharacterized protein n=1 Tax=Lojkania enalia TaxID=147567 RepID=A0A9P4N4L7_9PLEO|nr:hypothetical protein CC78DRAFT_535144 [Didymosphaeria enalia]